MESKPWFKSWTIWVNLVGAVGVALIEALEGAGVTSEYAVMVLAAANMLLRLKTAPITIS